MTELVVVNTHKGLYHLPFGVAAAPAIFQQMMESILHGLPNVCVYLDDILVVGTSVETHLQNLETVLRCLVFALNGKSFLTRSGIFRSQDLGRRLAANGGKGESSHVRPDS